MSFPSITDKHVNRQSHPDQFTHVSAAQQALNIPAEIEVKTDRISQTTFQESIQLVSNSSPSRDLTHLSTKPKILGVRRSPLRGNAAGATSTLLSKSLFKHLEELNALPSNSHSTAPFQAPSTRLPLEATQGGSELEASATGNAAAAANDSPLRAIKASPKRKAESQEISMGNLAQVSPFRTRGGTAQPSENSPPKRQAISAAAANGLGESSSLATSPPRRMRASLTANLNDLIAGQELERTPTRANPPEEEVAASIPLNTNLFIISNLLSRLEEMVHPESFTQQAAAALILEIDVESFKIRSDERAKNLLYNPSFFLRLCELKTLIENSGPISAGIRYEDRTIMCILGIGLAKASDSQKVALINTLSKDQISQNPIYTFFAQDCFKRYYRTVDGSPQLTNFPSNRLTLQRVITHCNESLNNSDLTAHHSTIAKVAEYATNELKKLDTGLPVELDRLYHFTETQDAAIAILKTGIQVTHQKLYEGAFVSTHLEESFGKFGVSVSSKQLVGRKHTHIERRDIEDNGAVWIGSSIALATIADRIFYSSAVSQEELAQMRSALDKAELTQCELISASVQNVFLRYARAAGLAVPIPNTTSPGRLKTKSRGKQ